MDNKTNRGKLVRKYIGEEIEKFKLIFQIFYKVYPLSRTL